MVLYGTESKDGKKNLNELVSALNEFIRNTFQKNVFYYVEDEA